MFGRVLALGLVLASTAAVAAEAQAPSPCSVTISYTSAAGSIDTVLAQKIDRQFRHDPRIAKRQRQMGHHGGYDICLTVQPAAKARTVFRAIRALMPAYSTKAPTTLTYAGGGHYQTKYREP